jgi:hypothetical protein
LDHFSCRIDINVWTITFSYTRKLKNDNSSAINIIDIPNEPMATQVSNFGIIFPCAK